VRAKIWGSRGSLAAPGPETVRYGGNTSCIEIRLSNDRLIVIDAGTGIRGLGIALGGGRPDRIDILLSHLHLDHIEGLAFFTPIWDSTCEIHLWGPASPLRTLKQDIARYFSPPLFPIHVDDIPSDLHFHDVTAEEFGIGSARIRAEHVTHPGPTVGYRLEEDRKVMAYISDHEPALGTDMLNISPEWISGYGLARGADVLFHDAQYTEDEYHQRVGWGHSSIVHTVNFALIAKVQRLMMFHHDPLHSDAQLEAMLMRARELWGAERDGLELSYEGMELEIG
jgi:phosphoribosyl 1,2-cyclic phosphodiesterase